MSMNKNTKLRDVLLRSFRRMIYVLLALLLIIVMSLLFLNFYGISLTKVRFPALQYAHKLHDSLDENTLLLSVYVSSKTPQLEKKLEQSMSHNISDMVTQLQGEIEQPAMKKEFVEIANDIERLRRIEWRVIDIANSQESKPAYFYFSSRVLPVYTRLRQNLKQAMLSDSVQDKKALFTIYHRLSRAQNLISDYVSSNGSKKIKHAKASLKKLSSATTVMPTMTADLSDTSTLLNRYLVYAKHLLSMPKKSYENAAKYEFDNSFMPLRNVIHHKLENFLLKQSHDAQFVSSILFYSGIFIVVLTIIVFLFFIIYGRYFSRFLERIVLDPIERLTSVMRESAFGRYPKKIKKRYLFEFNQLIDSFFFMMKQKKLGEKKLEYSAYHDSVTGLANAEYIRRYFDSVVKKCFVKDRVCSILFCFVEVKNLNQLNTLFGPKQYEHFIRCFAETLKLFDETYLFCVRYSTNHFILCLKIKNTHQSEAILSHLQQAMADFFNEQKFNLPIYAYVGASILPDQAKDFDTLLKYAGFSVREARNPAAKNEIVFDDAQKQSLERFEILRKDLNAANLEKQLTVVYQPQFDTKHDKLSGFEVLARWTHPILGDVSPGEFISVAERNEKMVEVGELIQERAVAQAAVWVEKFHFNTKLAINASLQELANADYVPHLLGLIKKYNLSASLFEVELTESLVAHNQAFFEGVIESLKAEGFGTAIDDFGSEYSTLERLKTLSVDLLKIDKIFVDDICQSDDARNLMASIIDMAHSMGKLVLVEGVETEKQLVLLKNMGCDYAQGYCFAKPMTADEVEARYFNSEKKSE